MELDQVKNSACNKFQSLESKIIELNQVINKYEKYQICLENMLSKQRYLNDKCGLDFFKFDKPSTSKTISIKATRNKLNIVESSKVHGVIDPKRPYVWNNSYIYKMNHVFRPTYFYYNTKGHTPNTFYIRNYGVPYDEYVWVRKGINPKRSK